MKGLKSGFSAVRAAYWLDGGCLGRVGAIGVRIRPSVCVLLPTKTWAASPACTASKTEAALRSCRAEQLHQIESELATILDRLRRNIAEAEPRRLKALEASQALWTAFRDAECRVETFDSQDGSAFDIYWNECLFRMTEKRMDQLSAMLSAP